MQMLSEPLLSVIVPAHNSAEFIEKCLHSVKYQTFTDYELIVVCDSCTDKTAEIALGYADKILIRDYHRDGLARNAGIDAAKGEYIVFLDSDDWFLHEFVFRQIEQAIKHQQFDMLETGVVWKTVGYIGPVKDRWLRMIGGKVIRREFIGDTRFSNREYSSDTDFLEALVRKRPRFLWWDMPMYYYNYGREGSLSDRHNKGEI